jgi:hypothetical protein
MYVNVNTLHKGGGGGGGCGGGGGGGDDDDDDDDMGYVVVKLVEGLRGFDSRWCH